MPPPLGKCVRKCAAHTHRIAVATTVSSGDSGMISRTTRLETIGLDSTETIGLEASGTGTTMATAGNFSARPISPSAGVAAMA